MTVEEMMIKYSTYIVTFLKLSLLGNIWSGILMHINKPGSLQSESCKPLFLIWISLRIVQLSFLLQLNSLLGFKALSYLRSFFNIVVAFSKIRRYISVKRISLVIREKLITVIEIHLVNYSNSYQNSYSW